MINIINNCLNFPQSISNKRASERKLSIAKKVEMDWRLNQNSYEEDDRSIFAKYISENKLEIVDLQRITEKQVMTNHKDKNPMIIKDYQGDD